MSSIELAGIEEQAIETARGAGRDQQLFPDFYAEYFPTQKLPKRGTAVCVGPIAYKGHAAVQKDIAIFKAALKGATVADAFLPVVAPASAVPRSKNEYYKDEEEFLFKLAEALREEYKAIVDAGLIVQIDDAFLPYMYDWDSPPTKWRNIGSGPRCVSMHSTTPSPDCPRIASVITSVGEALIRRTSPMCR